MFQYLNVSKFHCFKVSMFHCFNVSKFQCFKRVQCFNIHDGSMFGEHEIAQKCSYVIQWYTAVYSIMIRIVCNLHLNCSTPRWILIVNVI